MAEVLPEVLSAMLFAAAPSGRSKFRSHGLLTYDSSFQVGNLKLRNIKVSLRSEFAGLIDESLNFLSFFVIYGLLQRGAYGN